MIRSLFHRSRDRALSLTLSPTSREVLRQHLTPLTPQKLQIIEHHARLLEKRKIDGDFVECGVNLGGSAIVLSSLLSPSRRFRGYDVVAENPHTLSMAADDHVLNRTFATFGLEIDNRRIGFCYVAVENGLFLDPDRTIALAHVNCEWPSLGLLYLNAIAPQMAAGGFILVDERNDRGHCRDAIDHFLRDRPNFSLELDAKGSSIIQCNRAK